MGCRPDVPEGDASWGVCGRHAGAPLSMGLPEQAFPLSRIWPPPGVALAHARRNRLRCLDQAARVGESGRDVIAFVVKGFLDAAPARGLAPDQTGGGGLDQRMTGIRQPRRRVPGGCPRSNRQGMKSGNRERAESGRGRVPFRIRDNPRVPADRVGICRVFRVPARLWPAWMLDPGHGKAAGQAGGGVWRNACRERHSVRCPGTLRFAPSRPGARS